MKDLVLELMETTEDIEFILSRKTAVDVCLALIKDGIVFEDMDYHDVADEIEKSTVLLLGQILTEDGYIYFVQDYLWKDKTIEIDGNIVVIEDEIEDLVDYTRLKATDLVLIGEDDDEELDCECEYCNGFNDGYNAGYNEALSKVLDSVVKL